MNAKISRQSRSNQQQEASSGLRSGGRRSAPLPLTQWSRMVVATVRDHFSGNSEIAAGAVAFFTVLSLAPLLVVAVAMVGTVFGTDATRERLIADVTAAWGSVPAGVVEEFVRHAALDEGRWWRVAIGVAIAAWGATRMFVRLQETLNMVWGVEPRDGLRLGERVRVLLRKRALSFLLIALVGALLVASMLLQSVGSGLQAIASELRFVGLPWRLLQIAMSIAVVTAFLIPVYCMLPDVELGWREVWRGALMAAVIAALGAWLIGIYFGYAATKSVSGAAGGVLILLLWIYFDAHVLLFGARFARTEVNRRRGTAKPEPHAQLVTP